MAVSPELFAAFDRAMELEDAEREAFLSDLDFRDPDQAQRIRTLIEQYDEERSFFEDPLLPRFVTPAFGREETEPKRVGVYNLVHMLGRGGMGTVWLADRADGEIKMKAAAKLVKPDIATPDFIRRFRRERQIVADLRHPYIAAFYDAGTTESGQPYLIMEYVEGQNIDRFCAEKRPDSTQCLLLFRKICEAVDHAHSQGILHRDIKPGNIMIAQSGEPKLLDFGIARPLLVEEEKLTKPGQAAMTPEYAAPEILAGQPAGVTGDIYALGLVLANMLTGKRPNDMGYDKAEAIADLLSSAGDLHLAEVLSQALAGNVEDRFASVSQMIQAVDNLLGASSGVTTPLATVHFDALIWACSNHLDAAAEITEILEVRYGLSFAMVNEHEDDPETLRRVLAESACVLVFLGTGGAPWHHQQARLILEQGYKHQRVTPVLLPGADRLEKESELPPFLRRREWLGPYDARDTDSMESLSRAIRGLSSDTTTQEATSTCPFLGLAAFTEKDERFFFGRKSLTQRLLLHMETNRFMAVLGPSGSGKSSLVQAGVLPGLRSHGSVIGLFSPSGNPLEELAFVLSRLFPDTHEIYPEQLCSRLRSGSQALNFIVRELCDAAKTDHVLLVLDQFEEIFTLTSDREEADQFVANLLQALELPCGLSIILTLRSDFVGKCVTWPDLNTYLMDHFVQVGPMTRNQLQEAITEPARLAGLRFEEGLVDRIIDDVCGASVELPLLEHALLELWQRRRGRLLTFAAYQYIGGIEGALTRRAETEYEALDEEGRLLLRKMFTLCLVHPMEEAGDTRRRASRSEILSVGRDPENSEALLQRFVSARLFTIQRDEARREDMVDVAHEALIRGWERVGLWMLEDRAVAHRIDRLRRQARAWEESGRDRDHLLRGGLLFQMAELLEQEDQHLGELEKEFIIAGLDYREMGRRRKRRIRNLAMASGVLGVVLALVAFAMYFKASSAEKTAREAEQIARREQTRAERQKLEANYNLALAFDMHASSALDQGRAEEAWLLSLAALSQEVQTDKDLPISIGRVLDPRMARADRLLWMSPVVPGQVCVASRRDGKQLALAGIDRVIRLIDPETGIQTGDLGKTRRYAVELAYSPDNRFLAAATDKEEVVLWRLSENSPTTRKDGHQGRVTCLAFSSDSSLLASGDEAGQVIIRATEGNEAPLTVQCSGPVDDLSFDSFDGKFHVVADGALWELNPTTGKLKTLSETPAATTLVFDGELRITGNKDGSLTFARAGSQTRVPGHNEPIEHLIADPMGGRVISVSENRSMLWDSRQAASEPLSLPPRIKDMSWSSIGILNLCLENGSLQRIRLKDGKRMPEPVGHTKHIHQLDISPDEQHMIALDSDQVALLWEPGSQPPRRLNFEGLMDTSDILFSSDGQWAAAPMENGDIQLLNLERNKVERLLRGHSIPVIDLDFSSDGRWLASGDGQGLFILWDLTSPSQPYRSLDLGAKSEDLVFTPDEPELLIGTRDRKLRTWNPETGATSLITEGEFYMDLLFSGDGAKLYAAQRYRNMEKWNWITGKLESSSSTPYNQSIALSPDEKSIYVSREDTYISIWDTQTLTKSYQFQSHPGALVKELGISDGRLVSTATDSTIKIWDINRLPQAGQFRGHSENTLFVNFSPDNRYLFTTSIDGTAKMWRISDGSLVRTFGKHGQSTGSIVVSPDGKLVAFGIFEELAIYEVTTGIQRHLLPAHTKIITSIRFSADSKTVITSSWDHFISVWDLETGKRKRLLTDDGPVSRLALYPDGRRLASSNFNGAIKIWDLETESEPIVLRGHSDRIYAIDISSDGARLVSSSEDHTIRLWDAETGAAIEVMHGHTEVIDSVVFSPDGKWVASSGLEPAVRLWDAQTGRLVAVMDNFEGHANDLAFSPDSRFLALPMMKSVLLVDMNRLLLPPPEVDARNWYGELLKRSLMHFGYRLEGFRLVYQPRMRFMGSDVPSKSSSYDHIDSPRPPDVPLVDWLMTGYREAGKK